MDYALKDVTDPLQSDQLEKAFFDLRIYLSSPESHQVSKKLKLEFGLLHSHWKWFLRKNSKGKLGHEKARVEAYKIYDKLKDLSYRIEHPGEKYSSAQRLHKGRGVEFMIILGLISLASITYWMIAS